MKPAACNPIFRASVLEFASARRAFPLVHLFKPATDLGAWLSFVREATRRRTSGQGLATLEDERGYIHAVFAFGTRHHLAQGKTLHVTDMVIAHLPGRTLMQAIIDSIGEISDREECAAILVEFTDINRPDQREALRRAGYLPIDAHSFLIRLNPE